MGNVHKAALLAELRQRFGELRKVVRSESLFILGDDAARIYIRYSKVHSGGRTFFGLRDWDLRQLEGQNAFLCFLLDDGSPPVFIPFADFEEVFREAETAQDGQYKVQLLTRGDTRELYVARQGRFNVEGYVGFDTMETTLDKNRLRQARELSHSQVQTLLGAVGRLKGYEVRIPQYDVGKLDWRLVDRFPVLADLPPGYDRVSNVLSEIDVVWVSVGRRIIAGLFEVEHSTPVYSALLRFNDLLLTDPGLSRFTIVSNETRRTLFSKQLFRPTFVQSGLSELAAFLEYGNVYDWHARLLQARRITDERDS